MYDETLSPTQKTPHKNAAKASPPRSCLHEKCCFSTVSVSCCISRAKLVRHTAEPVMVIQKFAIPVVQGENMKNHNRAATVVGRMRLMLEERCNE